MNTPSTGYNFRQMTICVLLSLGGATCFGQQPPSIDIKWYNNLYSQTQSFDANGDKMDENRKSSFLTSILQMTFREKEKLNFGLDAYFRASHIDSSGGSPFRVLELKNDGELSRASLTHLGPKVVYTPNDNTWIRAILLFPLDNTQGPANSNLPFLDNTGYRFWLQYGKNLQLDEKWYLYLEGSAVYRFDRAGPDMPNDFYSPLKAFLSYFIAGTPVGLFGFADFTPTLTQPSSFYLQAGAGIKLFPSDNWEIELSSSKFLAGRSSGAGYTLNFALGYRILTQN